MVVLFCFIWFFLVFSSGRLRQIITPLLIFSIFYLKNNKFSDFFVTLQHLITNTTMKQQ